MSAGYDTINKTQLVIHVGEKMQRVICKDGRVLNFSYEPQELRDFILCQLAQHQISGVQNLAKVMGWQVLSSSSFLGGGAVEPFGSAAGCMLGNSRGTRFLAVRHSPQSNYSVYMGQVQNKHHEKIFILIKHNLNIVDNVPTNALILFLGGKS